MHQPPLHAPSAIGGTRPAPPNAFTVRVMRLAAPLLQGAAMVPPADFGQVYVGEDFRAFVRLTSNVKIAADAQIRIEAQVGGDVVALAALDGEYLTDGVAREFVVTHTIRQPGVHRLVCSVKYTGDVSGVLVFQKFFKLSALHAVNFSSSVRECGDYLFVKSELLNLMTAPFLLRSATLVGKAFTLSSSDLMPSEGKKGFKSIVLPKETWSILFRVSKPQVRDQTSQDGSFAIGYVNIDWTSVRGERGSLRGDPIVWRTEQPFDLSVELVDHPARVLLESSFQVRIKVLNLSQHRVIDEVQLYLDSARMGYLRPSGISMWKIIGLGAGESRVIVCNLVALATGVHRFEGLCANLTALKRMREFDTLAEFFVESKPLQAAAGS